MTSAEVFGGVVRAAGASPLSLRRGCPQWSGVSGSPAPVGLRVLCFLLLGGGGVLFRETWLGSWWLPWSGGLWLGSLLGGFVLAPLACRFVWYVVVVLCATTLTVCAPWCGPGLFPRVSRVGGFLSV